MHNQSINKIAAPIKPLNDTWAGKKSAGKWFIVPPFDFTNLSTSDASPAFWFYREQTGGEADSLRSLVQETGDS
ncbi:MAG: hypothetical protein V7L04_30290 [Nostoc sp.]|uniref:hypothetical protein n=1 Tax=Nostoc sp. TaxID=1180 RepID=UPI002FFCF60E